VGSLRSTKNLQSQYLRNGAR